MDTFALKRGGWRLVLAPLMAAASFSCAAEVRLHGIFGAHMVLQQNMPIPVGGSAAPGEIVRVSFRRQQAQAAADQDGNWRVQLRAEAAGGPDELVVRGSASAAEVHVADVLVGEVWLCAGQSNMEWALEDAADGRATVAAAGNSQIRHIKLPHATSLRPSTQMPPVSWQVSAPETAGKFSAVAYYFARKVQRERGVAVGIINVSWGGTHLETWMSRDTLQQHAELRALVPRMPASNEEFAALQRRAMDEIVAKWQGEPAPAGAAAHWAEPGSIDRDWRTLRAPGIWEDQGLDGFDGVLWYRRRVTLDAEQARQAATLHLGAVDDCDETHVNGVHVGGQCGWELPRQYVLPRGLLKEGENLIAVRVTDTGGGGGFHGDPARMKLMLGEQVLALSGAWKARVEAPLYRTVPAVNDLPAIAYNAMLHPLVGLPMRGMLWYQGESNVPRAAQYASSFPLFIRDLRARWGQDEFPFLFVQLASFQPLARNSYAGSEWSELRDAQRQALALANTGMVVATDIGDADDIHPRNKRAVGERLAALAAQHAYREPIDAASPLPREAIVRGGRIDVRLDHVAGGLRVHGDTLRGFAIADASGIFRPALARLDGSDRVLVWHPDVPRPAWVRYAWLDNPQESNLFNDVGLPVAPFRTDTLPLVTAGRGFSF